MSPYRWQQAQAAAVAGRPSDRETPQPVSDVAPLRDRDRWRYGFQGAGPGPAADTPPVNID